MDDEWALENGVIPFIGCGSVNSLASIILKFNVLGQGPEKHASDSHLLRHIQPVDLCARMSGFEACE